VSDEKPPVYLTAKQVSQRYGVSRQWAYHSPDIAHLRIKIGRVVRWKLEDLEAFEAENKERGAILALYKEQQREKRRAKIKFGLVEKAG